MSASKRSRACEACHSIKIKCELGSNSSLSPPCERCVRLHKDCVVTPPVRQKDRVAELEAKVEALTRLLQAQGLGEFRPRDGESIPDTLDRKDVTTGSKKRRLDDARPEERPGSAVSEAESGPSAIAGLDAIASLEQQDAILTRYRDEICPVFPLVLIPEDATLYTLRVTKPHLLLAVMYGACPGILSQEDQESVAKALMSCIANAVMYLGEKSLELVQAIQILSLWYRSPKHQKTITLDQFIATAHGMANDLSFGSLNSEARFAVANPQWEGEPSIPHENTEEVWRAWLVCHMLSSNMNVLIRRPMLRAWTRWHDNCLSLLEYWHGATSTDRLMCQIVRAERMCEEIAVELHFADSTIVHEVSNPLTKLRMEKLEKRILDWTTQIPSNLQSPTIALYQHVVTLYLHESVLHTSTNKRSFSAPFVAERLSVTDFPAPVHVTSEHIASLQSLAYSGAALINLVTTIDVVTWAISPGFMLAARVLYGLYILLKVYISCTGPGNTYGMIFTTDSLQLESCFARLRTVAEKIRVVDEKAAPSRIMSAVTRAEEWFRNYNASLQGASKMQDDLAAMSSQQAPSYMASFDDSKLVDEQPLPQSSTYVDQVNWSEYLLMPDDVAMGFGFETLFDE